MAKKVNDKKIESKGKGKSKPASKRLIAVIAVIVIICVIGLMWFVLSSDATTARAELIIDSGTVQVKHSGESWISAENGMDLYESDSVKTGDDSSASIILFKSSIIRLASNTEVTLKDIIEEEETSVTIEQDAGRTWNTVQKMSGIDNYEVQTSTTVASVRGTSFDVYILANGNITITVGNGTVNVTTYEDGEIVFSIEVPEYLYVTIDPKYLDKMPELKPYEVDEWILENLQKDEEFRADLREELYSRIEPFIPELKETFGMTDEELDVLIDGYLSGYFEIPSDAPDWAKKLFEFS